ncbi:MAG: dTMP kinase [Clostridia bacterium]|nr:dTMP kinase [Clostridia bacterium]
MIEQRGRFIVFEGIDGAGKTTQIARLEAKLRAEGRRVMVTAEPTVSVTGGLLRDALGGISKRTAGEMAALFVLDRIFHNVNPVTGIEKMLADGVDVICDRYYYSSLAYQGSETDFDWVANMNLNCPEIRRPDCCIFLDLTPEQSLARISADRVSREIYEEESRLQAVRDKFYHVFDLLRERDVICVIDASGSVDEVAARVVSAVEEVFA